MRLSHDINKKSYCDDAFHYMYDLWPRHKQELSFSKLILLKMKTHIDSFICWSAKSNALV